MFPHLLNERRLSSTVSESFFLWNPKNFAITISSSPFCKEKVFQKYFPSFIRLSPNYFKITTLKITLILHSKLKKIFLDGLAFEMSRTMPSKLPKIDP